MKRWFSLCVVLLLIPTVVGVVGAGTAAAAAAPNRPTADAIGRELASIRAAYPALPNVNAVLWDRAGGNVAADTILLHPNSPNQTGWGWRDGLWHAAGEALAAKRAPAWHGYAAVRKLDAADPGLLLQIFAEDFRRCFGPAAGPRHTYTKSVGEPTAAVCDYLRTPA